MRINKFVALATGLSRRAADQLVTHGRVTIDGRQAEPGDEATGATAVRLDGQALALPTTVTIMLNKPTGYVVSRHGQGSKTIYDLLPAEYHHLKSVGRLDKDSSGLLLLTNNGSLANELTHPRYTKTKVYEVELDKPLTLADKAKIEQGIQVNSYVSRLKVESRGKGHEARQTAATRDSELVARGSAYKVSLAEGKNRQIRRTFAALGYTVTTLHRTHFGRYTLGSLETGNFKKI